jgi:hypothetical protein
MSFVALLVAVAVLVVAGVVVAILMTRRRRASMHSTPHARVHPESLLADLDDTMGRTELAAREWRRRRSRHGSSRRA